MFSSTLYMTPTFKFIPVPDANKFVLVTTLADKFQEENPRFDRARFINATSRGKPAGEGQPSEQRAKIA